MYFDEGRGLNQSHYKNPETRKLVNPVSQSARRSPSCAVEVEGAGNLKTANMLDSANNKLQELMQLLYLLSRDPAVPSNARYHVTVAQGEIALLAHVMRNSAEPESTNSSATASDMGLQAAHP